MPKTEAQRRASNKYDAEYMKTVGCKLKKEDATAFKEYCKRNGKTTNETLKTFVFACIGKKTE